VRTNLSGCTLKDVTLDYADLSSADLRNTRFAQTYMNNTSFSGADLSGAIFDTSAFENADFSGANLQGVKYDSIALGFFAVSKLDGAKLSPDLQKEFEERSRKITVRDFVHSKGFNMIKIYSNVHIIIQRFSANDIFC
jgi:hypothetical protein